MSDLKRSGESTGYSLEAAFQLLIGLTTISEGLQLFKAGNLKYEDYTADPENDNQAEPWKLKAKELAVQLTERAGRCVRRNEASWRFACEPLIFARLNADVAW